MLWGVVTGMVHCGVVLRWADVHSDDAPRKVPEAFRGAVRWGGRRVEVRGRATRPQVRSIKPCSPSATCVTTNQMEQSGEKPRKRVGSIAHRVDHSLFATTSSKQQAAPGQAQVHVHVHVPVHVRVEVEVEASRGRKAITEGRGGRGNGSTGQSKWELTT